MRHVLTDRRVCLFTSIFFFFQAEDGIRDLTVTGVQTCALPICLSWDTILRKRARYREVFDGFDPTKVARYDKEKVRELLRDAGIVRNRLKIHATVGNARAFLEVQKEFGTFDAYIWRFVGGQPKQNAWKTHKRVPATTLESDALSKDLQKRGFRFVGSTICYALMQATGMVNDHLFSCFRFAELKKWNSR